MKRVLGVVEGKSGGPLIILLGGLHGNEVAGIKAINKVLQVIHQNQVPINGTLVGLAGNLQALASNRRFIGYDLNRCWTEDFINRVYHQQHTQAEDIELKDLHQIIMEFKNHEYQKRLLIDLHSTSSEQGNFVVVPGSEAMNPVVQSLQQPVVIDLDQYLSGTLLKYLYGQGFFSLAFEGGLIGSPEAIELNVSGIWRMLEASGAIGSAHINGSMKSGKKVRSFSRLPNFVKVRYHHKISELDKFVMHPGFANFQRIKAGQLVASDRNGPVYAPVSGLMFLPLYQSSGDDGFFIVEEVSIMEAY
ncbi:MAG: hypothetical protein DHS20C17_29470 [Cyclobacteriaceae bacterium]|nr:MAG: hypothetical protein DHS20C17_29470 [Cyclobacteriaceae bacterium]